MMNDWEDKENPLDRMVTLEVQGQGEFALYNSTIDQAKSKQKGYTKLHSGIYLVPTELAKTTSSQEIKWYDEDVELRRKRYRIISTNDYLYMGDINKGGLELTIRQFPGKDSDTLDKLNLDIFDLAMNADKDSNILRFMQNFVRNQLNAMRSTYEYDANGLLKQLTSPVKFHFLGFPDYTKPENFLDNKGMERTIVTELMKPEKMKTLAGKLLGDNLKFCSEPEYDNLSLLTWYSFE
jgi:hypothetical protein